ncbi:MAG: hypothetical protein UH625_06590 [Muribaculaceae bacterium]|nr:hypothetical protein [Muribaculaceae bacterium]
MSENRRQMPMEARAAQFAPFAALTGHSSAIDETARFTSSQRDLSAEELHMLSTKISYALSIAEQPELSITYFKPDDRKEGGDYVTVQGSIKSVEVCFNILRLVDGTEIPLDSVADISGEVFADME